MAGNVVSCQDKIMKEEKRKKEMVVSETCNLVGKRFLSELGSMREFFLATSQKCIAFLRVFIPEISAKDPIGVGGSRGRFAGVAPARPQCRPYSCGGEQPLCFTFVTWSLTC